jgi:hypothetical protein
MKVVEIYLFEMVPLLTPDIGITDQIRGQVLILIHWYWYWYWYWFWFWFWSNRWQ